MIRMRDVYRRPPDEAAHIIIDLVEETFALIETYLPEVNITRLREIFRFRRPTWENQPPTLEI